MRKVGLLIIRSSFCGLIVCCMFCVGQVYGQAKYTPEASIYQYSAPVGSRHAYLWVPPKCEQVRGLIVSFASMLERHWCEDPVIRKAATRNGLGILLIGSSATGVDANLTSSGKQAFLQLLKALADSSGYNEITDVPFIPIDHSVHSVLCWNLCAWMPQRVIAGIPVKGQPIPADAHIASIPFLYIIGENDEWRLTRNGQPFSRNYIWPYIGNSVTALRERDTNNLIGVATDPGGGHLDWPSRLSSLIALFIDKACRYRFGISKEERDAHALLTIDPQKGWLTDTGGLVPDRYPSAPYSRYIGSHRNAYWFFDKGMAHAAMSLAGDRKVRQTQMVSFMQGDTTVHLNGDPYVSLLFRPEMDGLTFKVRTAFLDRIPEELLGGGLPLGHAEGKISVSVIYGPARPMEDGHFKISLDRSGINDIWLLANHSGDHAYTRAVQPARMHLPVNIVPNDMENIHFDPITDQQAGRIKGVQLKATSKTGAPIGYLVNSGPAIIQGDRLFFTAIPKRSRHPVTVTVTAWRWTYNDLSNVYDLGTVSRSFHLTK